MTVVTISIIGIAAVLMAVQLKGLKGEYGIYLAAAADVYKRQALEKGTWQYNCSGLFKDGGDVRIVGTVR